MPTIIEENTKVLRKALDVKCAFCETNETYELFSPASTFEVWCETEPYDTVTVEMEDGTFIEVAPRWENLSNVPDEYQEVEYIESTGTQYIDTGIVINGYEEDYSMTLDYQYTHVPTQEEDIASVHTGDANTSWICGQNASGYIQNRGFDYFHNEPTQRNYSRGWSRGNTGLTMTLFAQHHGQYGIHWFASARLFSVTLDGMITPQGATYSFLGTPCYRKSDGEIGLWDSESETFFGNDGTGTFKKGRNQYSYKATITLDNNAVGYTLGKIKQFDNDNLISVNAALRGVSTDIEDPQLEISEIEIKAYTTEDMTSFMETFVENSAIWYRAGYEGDMSPNRKFYLSEPVDWDNNVLTIKGQDATRLMADTSNMINEFIHEEDLSNYIVVENKDVLFEYFRLIRPSWRGLYMNPTYVGYDQIPRGSSTDQTKLLIDNRSERKQIAAAVNAFADGVNGFCLDYVDAGIPTFRFIPRSEAWQISDTQISDFKTNIDLKVTGVNADIITADASNTLEELYRIENAVVGANYYFESPDPINEWSISGGSVVQYGSYKVNIEATSTTIVISGKRIKVTETPYYYYKGSRGTTKSADSLPSLIMDDYDYTRAAIRGMIDRSNVTYEFYYRGNPKIQPRDIIDLTMNESITKMVVESITHKHINGGYHSEIKARYIDRGGLLPSDDLFPSDNLYPY